MEILKRKTVYNGKYIRVTEKDFLSRSGEKGTWECVERKIYKGVVIIFALTEKKEVLLERIFRIPPECYVIELPAGLTDKKGESEREAAKRELLEETGYRAGKIIPVFSGVVVSGLLSVPRTIFFASDLKFVGRKKEVVETGEEIEVIKVPLGKMADFLVNPPRGTKVNIEVLGETLGLLPILKKKGLI